MSRPSVDVGSLGSHQSWGYGSTGKKSTGNMYQPYPANQVSCSIEQASNSKPQLQAATALSSSIQSAYLLRAQMLHILP